MRLKTILKGVLGLVVLLATAAVLYLRLPWIRYETIRFRSGDITLVGTLMLPRWEEGPYPAAVVVQGSSMSPRWLYWLYARRLVPFGMAALIYDKRSVGESGGASALPARWSLEGIANCGAAFDVLANDALAGVEALRVLPEIDAQRVGFLGVSQAGWIMPLAASRSSDVAFIVNISGPAVSCGVEDWYSQLTGEYAAYPESGGPVDFHDGDLSDEEIDRRLDQYRGPEGFDPVPVLAMLKVPSLWLLGARDRSVPTSRSVANLDRLIAQGAPFAVKVYPNGDHILRHREPGEPSFEMSLKYMLFRQIDYWPDVRTWLTERRVIARANGKEDSSKTNRP